MTPARRVFAEKRRLIVPLLVVLAIDVGVYAAVVYPLSLKVVAADTRAGAAQRALRAARQNYQTARGTLVGKERADTELRKFYHDVLPADLTGARRITYLRLARLAEQANLKFERRSVKVEENRDSLLLKLGMTMELAGDYRDIRRFIHQLETAAEFVVIEDVALTQGEERNAPLVLTLRLSTYYWKGGDGA